MSSGKSTNNFEIERVVVVCCGVWPVAAQAEMVSPTTCPFTSSGLAWCARTGFSSLPALACHRGVVGSLAHPGGPSLSLLQCAIRGEEIVEPGAVLVQWHNASLHQVCTMVGPHDLLTPRDVLAASVMHLSGGPVCACVRREVLRTFGPAFVAD